MLSYLRNLGVAPAQFLGMWGDALAGAGRLIGAGVGALRGGEGPVKARLLGLLKRLDVQRSLFAVLRAVAPVLSLSRVLVKSYPNTGTVIVTRRADVLDVLARDDAFEVVFEPRMRALTDGENFFLGMQPGDAYQRDVSAMRLAARRTDVPEIVLPRAQALAERIVAEAGADGRLDLPAKLTHAVPLDMIDHYFGTPGPSLEEMQAWTTIQFWYLFGDLTAVPEIEAGALAAAAEMRAYLDGVVATRKAALAAGEPANENDVIGRCLALQAAGVPGLDDVGIRNNMLGLLIGTVPTLSKASVLALDELLRRPEALAAAGAAARADDAETVAAHIWEALRFNPHQPLLYRRATRDTVIAPSALRTCRVKKGQFVFAMTLSAAFDRLAVPEPGKFRTDRPWEIYNHWGVGVHTCFGDAINRVMIPAILTPVLARTGLARAPEATGRVDTGGTPFPKSFEVVFDRD